MIKFSKVWTSGMLFKIVKRNSVGIAEKFDAAIGVGDAESARSSSLALSDSSAVTVEIRRRMAANSFSRVSWQ